ncbi:Molybdopterin biosynthesis MoaE [Ochromonadaceae sp. CCMP2298]|nr:Molybdopterin biosynthesis MoaE [Ochromonadaceae sp. CCMP2298]|mmetsp:Transcript_13630/g.30546  ORF Transcript_13630/g.30546 Transcript_13630/m.30546 type:complete len:168 (+) Transcript_13630:144-647(+)
MSELVERFHVQTRQVGECGSDEVSLTYDTINVIALIDQARSPSAGAVSNFIGTTRDNFEGKEVTHLEYEAYPEMAMAAMLEICSKARDQWSLIHIRIQHKLGPCPISDVSIAVVISSEHRKDSLEAVHFAIDELKSTVPIWKKEFYGEGGAVWKNNAEDKAKQAALS